MPDPYDDLGAWEVLIRQSATSWKRIIRDFLVSHARHVQLYALCATAERVTFDIMRDAGVPFAISDPEHPLRKAEDESCK
eukprot:7541787-Pyramimonas_sp.AAC.1